MAGPGRFASKVRGEFRANSERNPGKFRVSSEQILLKPL